MSTAGQCKVDPPTGVAGAAFTALMADGDNGMIAAVATSGSPERKLVGAQIQALVSALLGAGIIGSVSIVPGAASVVATNSAITSSSTVIAIITQAAADATLTSIVRVVAASGTCTIYGNANATSAVTVGYVVLN